MDSAILVCSSGEAGRRGRVPPTALQRNFDRFFARAFVAGERDSRLRFRFLQCTGLRLADMAGLTWKNADVTADTLTLTPGKTDKPRVQPMARELCDFLTSLSTGVGKVPRFPSPHGRITGRNGFLSNELIRLMQRAEIAAPVGREKEGRGRQMRTKSFYSRRHTFVSRLANADVSADVRKALAGHETDEAHARNTHLAFTKRTEALARLSAIGGRR